MSGTKGIKFGVRDKNGVLRESTESEAIESIKKGMVPKGLAEIEVVGADGEIVSIPKEAAPGFFLDNPSARLLDYQNEEALRKKEIAADSPGTAAAMGALETASFGVSTEVAQRSGHGEELTALKEENPKATFAGQAAGFLVPGAAAKGASMVAKGATKGAVAGAAAFNEATTAVRVAKPTAKRLAQSAKAKKWIIGGIKDSAQIGMTESLAEEEEVSLELVTSKVAENVLVYGALGAIGKGGKEALKATAPLREKAATSLKSVLKVPLMKENYTKRYAKEFGVDVNKSGDNFVKTLREEAGLDASDLNNLESASSKVDQAIKDKDILMSSALKRSNSSISNSTVMADLGNLSEELVKRNPGMDPSKAKKLVQSDLEDIFDDLMGKEALSLRDADKIYRKIRDKSVNSTGDAIDRYHAYSMGFGRKLDKRLAEEFGEEFTGSVREQIYHLQTARNSLLQMRESGRSSSFTESAKVLSKSLGMGAIGSAFLDGGFSAGLGVLMLNGPRMVKSSGFGDRISRIVTDAGLKATSKSTVNRAVDTSEKIGSVVEAFKKGKVAAVGIRKQIQSSADLEGLREHLFRGVDHDINELDESEDPLLDSMGRSEYDTKVQIHLQAHFPKSLSEDNPFRDDEYPQSALTKFDRRLQGVTHPELVLQNALAGSLNREGFDAIKELYPAVYRNFSASVADPEIIKKLTYSQRLGLKLLLGDDFFVKGGLQRVYQSEDEKPQRKPDASQNNQTFSNNATPMQKLMK